MKAKDLISVPPKIVDYGPAGTGKTALVSQAYNGYMFDYDAGMKTALLLEDKFTELRHQIEFDVYKDKDPRKPTNWIKSKQKILNISEQCAKGTFPYDAVIVDSLTGMAKTIMYYVMCKVNRPMGQPEIQHWGSMVSEMENILAVLTSLPVLVIITAHDNSYEVDDAMVTRILSMTKNHGDRLPFYFDEVWYAKTKQKPQNNVDYIVTGKKTRSIVARTRSGNAMMSDVVVNDLGLAGVLEKVGYVYGTSTKKEISK